MSLELLDKINPNAVSANISSLNQKLTDASADGDYQKAAEIQADITREQEKLTSYNKLKELLSQKDQATSLLSDSDMSELAELELAELELELASEMKHLQQLVLLKLEYDSKNALIEIRAGTGGTEASLFAEQIMRMYLRYANSAPGFKAEMLSTSHNTEGGIKETIFAVNGAGAFGHLRFESGVHRVQRVPSTESSGRIHTSAISVAVLPEIPASEVKIDPSDLKIDSFRSSGPGGQSVNTTDSAVRVTHLPSGITVSCQDGKSQHKNKEKAISILASKLNQLEQEKHAAKAGDIRKQAVKTGDRSAKIRTFNFPQGRVTDHRINQSWYNLTQILEGELGDVINQVNTQLRIALSDE